MLEVLLKMATLMAPFTPFFAEFVYQRLRPRLPGFADKANRPADEIGAADSIHYVMLPPRVKSKASCSDHGAVLEGMRLLQRAVELGRRARDIAKITMKTPVKSVVVVSTDATSLEALKQLEPYLLGELNAWSVQLTADVDSWCSVSALPNLPVLGRRLGKRVGLATNAIKQLDSHALRSVLAENKPVDLELGGEKVSVCLEELLVKFSFSGNADDYAAQTTPDGSLTVAVETTQDDALLAQGVARELVNRK